MRTRGLLMAVGLSMLLAGSLLAQSAPTLTSDKPDYAPDEVATLTGTGFSAGETVDLSISIDDSASGLHIGDYDWQVAQAGDDGSFVTSYAIPMEAAGMTLSANALGLSSASVATAQFMDKINLVPPTVTCVATTETTISVRVCGAGSYGAPEGFSLIWSVEGTDTTCAASFSGSAQGSIFGLRSGACVTITLAVPSGLPGESYDGGCVAPLQCGTTYAVSAFAHGGTLFNASPKSAPVSCTTADCQPPPPPECPDCPGNQAPTLSASNKDLGKLLGYLVDGSFETTVSLTLADLGVSASDPDGDPVVVTTSADLSNVTLVGPGVATVSVTLTATDDPSARIAAFNAALPADCEACPVPPPASVSTTVAVTAQIVYAGVGGTGSPMFEAPFVTSKALRVKKGSGFPLKFNLYDGHGREICTDLGAGAPWIDVVFQQDSVPDAEIEVDDAGAANDNTDLCRYGGTCGVDGTWIYNLKTNNGYDAGATYRARAHLNDGTTIEGSISIK